MVARPHQTRVSRIDLAAELENNRRPPGRPDVTGIKSKLEDLKIDRPDETVSGSRGWVVAVIAALAILALALWWIARPGPAQVRTVAAREVNSGNAQQTVLNASGYVTARRQATVSSKVTGKVVEVLIEEGMEVEEGQVLARLDLSNVNANLQLAEAQLAAARTALEETRVRLREAELELSRVESLVASQISSAADLDRARAEADSLEARLERQADEVTVAENQVGLWQQEVEDRIIRAPFAGIVVSKNAQPGEMISPVSAGGGFTRTGICTLVDMSSLEIEVDVNEAYINRVFTGQPVVARLDSYPEWPIPCHVIAIIPTADRQRATVAVRIGFEELDPRILPDMGVKVAFQEADDEGEERGRVVVPASALRRQEDRDVVLVVAEGRIERRAVELEETTEDEAFLTAGLSPGEKVVVRGPADLADGDQVRETSP